MDVTDPTVTMSITEVMGANLSSGWSGFKEYLMTFNYPQLVVVTALIGIIVVLFALVLHFILPSKSYRNRELSSIGSSTQQQTEITNISITIMDDDNTVPGNAPDSVPSSTAFSIQHEHQDCAINMECLEIDGSLSNESDLDMEEISEQEKVPGDDYVVVIDDTLKNVSFKKCGSEKDGATTTTEGTDQSEEQDPLEKAQAAPDSAPISTPVFVQHEHQDCAINMECLGIDGSLSNESVLDMEEVSEQEEVPGAPSSTAFSVQHEHQDFAKNMECLGIDGSMSNESDLDMEKVSEQEEDQNSTV